MSRDNDYVNLTLGLPADTVNPNVSIVVPANDSTYNDDADLNFNYTTSSDAESCYWHNGTGNTSLTCGTNMTINLTAGNHLFVLFVNDSDGNSNTTTSNFTIATPTIDLDLIYPTGSWENVSQNGDFFNITVNVTCRVADCGLVSVYFDPEVTLGRTDVIYDTQVLNEDSCGGTVNRYEGINLYIDDGGSGDGCGRSFVEFNTSSIPDTATITNVIYNISVGDKSAEDGIEVYSMELQPSDSSVFPLTNAGNTSLWTDIGNGTLYATITLGGVPAWYSADLGSTADTDLQNKLSSDWFAVGNHPKSGFSCVINSSDEEGANSQSPQLIVTYSNNPLSKGIIPANASASPFYTNASMNPWNITLTKDESQELVMWVNATGTVGLNYTTFVYANRSADVTDSNITSYWNTSIRPTAYDMPPNITIVYPANDTTYKGYTDFHFNYTASPDADSCYWWNGTGNTTLTCGTNMTINLTTGNYLFILFANNTVNNHNVTTPNCTLDLTQPA
jgi:hypothetical protein